MNRVRQLGLPLLGLILGGIMVQSPLNAEPLQTRVEQARALTLDIRRTRTVSGLQLEHAQVLHTLKGGHFFPVQNGAGQDVGVFFVGDGRLDYAPESGAERMALWPFFPVTESINRQFSVALLLGEVVSTLPQEDWQSASLDGSRALRAFERRMDIYEEQWAAQAIPGDKVHEALPSLPFDLLSSEQGSDFTWIDCNARPRAHGLPGTSLSIMPGRWWTAWYYRSDGAWPVVEQPVDGVLFTHGPTQLGYRAYPLYLANPGLLAAKERIQGQTITLDVDGKGEQVRGTQVVRFFVPKGGQLLRLPLMSDASRSLGGKKGFSEALVRVVSVQLSDGTVLPYETLNKEVLVDVPSGKNIELAVSVEGTWPLRMGTQSHAGPFELWSPRMMDEAAKIEVNGPVGYQTILLSNWDGVQRGVAPALAIGRYVEATVKRDDGRSVTTHLFESPGYSGLDEPAYDRRGLDFSPPILRVTSTATQRANLLAMDIDGAVKTFAELLGPLPWSSLEVVQYREPHPNAPTLSLPGWLLLDERTLYPQGDEHFSQLDYHAGLAGQIVDQYLGAQLSLGEDWESEWLLLGLRHALVGWYLEKVLADHPSLDEYLDRYLSWAENLEGAVPRLSGSKVAYSQAQVLGATARGYLLFNQLRYFSGEVAFGAGIQEALETLQGQLVTKSSLESAMKTSFPKAFERLFAQGVAQAPYRGRSTVTYRIDNSVLLAKMVDEEAGPNEGSVLVVTLEDLTNLEILVPRGGSLASYQFSKKVLNVKLLKRAGGLSRWSFLELDPNLN